MESTIGNQSNHCPHSQCNESIRTHLVYRGEIGLTVLRLLYYVGYAGGLSITDPTLTLINVVFLIYCPTKGESQYINQTSIHPNDNLDLRL